MNKKLKIYQLPIKELNPSPYNPRRWDDKAIHDLTESIRRFGLVDPIIVNAAPNRKNTVIGGHFRLKVSKDLGYKEVPVVYVNIPDVEKEKELNLRLNKNVGGWDWDLLAKFDESFLSDSGFISEELDEIFPMEEIPEEFNLQKELEKLGINGVAMRKGEIYQLGDSKLLVGDSTVEEDILRLMDEEKADLCLTDPPYLLDYLNGKQRHGKATTGFGLKRDRRYLETDVLPPDFTQKWMANIANIQKPDFSIIVFENPKNLRTIWNELEKHWIYRNTIVWHLPNRVQGFAAKYKFFNKHDIALVGTSEGIFLNTEREDEFFQNEYENALYATSGKPTWEGYEKGRKIQPTDYIECKASNEKSSGQGIIFGTKPIEILIPYIKVLTKRGDLIIEPFGGSGSTLIAAEKMKRRCYILEKVPTYAEVIKVRWEKLTGKKAIKIS